MMAFKKNVFTGTQAMISATLSSCEELSVTLPQSTKSRPSRQRSKREMRRAVLLKHVLADLGFCHEISYRLNAEKLGIPLDRVSVRFIDEIAVSSLLNLRQDEPDSNQPIQVEVILDSPASDTELASLKGIVDRHCPGLNVLRSLTPVQSSIRSSSWSLAAE
ncbi:hypothetical protein XI07_05065 [Bradyrhizobium sp. CCBAU 11445]|uniref:OsmC family protein n=1 Tax=Bradyrhizobium sp. CCBAU 11445 TaxID=1630896 RepID=UPI002304D8A8|nr:OsmC family protein [Bradyrhizobium sp. CCBAU 11445]MDA9481389.1 hypothetical protein [Bradyrhizobium sp. CCBAU 11445]